MLYIYICFMGLNINKYIYIYIQYFVKATKHICGEAYLTFSYVILIYNMLLNKLEDFRETPNRFENGKVN